MRIVGKKILVHQTLTDKVSKGGIVMAGNQQALPFGTVVQIGNEVKEVSVGEVLLFTEIGAIPLGIKKDHVLIEFEDVLAVLDEEDVKDART